MALDATVAGSSADTYGTLAEADAYFAARQSAAWGADDTVKAQALRKAATYLDGVYRGKWRGQRVDRDQARAWPRSYAIDSDGYSIEADIIPVELKNAQFEAAKLFAAGTDLEAPLERAVKSERVGELAVEYMDSAALQAQYPQITNWLGELINGGSTVNGSFGSGSLVRA
jgi:hypothetical protein